MKSAWWFQFALVSLAYYLTGRIGLSIPYLDSHITLIWAPTGIALAALVRFGLSLWPAVWLGAFAVNLGIGGGAPLAFGIACGNTLAPLLAAVWLQRKGFAPEFSRRRDLVQYLAIGVFGGMLISATNGVAQLWWQGNLPVSRLWGAWSMWWLGDAMGALVCGIPLLTFSFGYWRSVFLGIRGREIGLVFALTLLVGAFIFGGYDKAPEWLLPILFLPFFLLCWLAIRGGIGVASVAALLLSMEAVSATAYGVGPFHAENLHFNLAMLWGYMATASIITVLVTILVGELRGNERRLALATVGAELGLWEWDIRLDRMQYSGGDVLGLLPTASESRCLQDVIDQVHPDDQGEMHWALEQHLDGKSEMLDVECRVRGKSADWIWVNMRGQVVERDLGGAPTCLAGTLINIDERKRNEQAMLDNKRRLRESEELYRLLFTNSPAGILHYDTDLVVTYVNTRFAEIMGTPVEYMQTLDCKTLKDQSVIPALSQAVAGEKAHYEGPYTTSYGGMPLWISMDCAPLINERGEILGGVAILEDITARKRAEMELSEFKFFTDQSSDMCYIIDWDTRIRYVNNMVIEKLGYSREEMLALSVPDIDPEHSQRQVQEIIEQCKYEVIPAFEALHRRRDGSTVQVEVTSRTHLFDGEWLCFAVARDISERKAMEGALRESEQRFRATFEQAAVGVAHVGLDGAWLRVNDKLCEILGYDRDELLSHGYQEVSHPGELSTSRKAIKRMIEGEIDHWQMEKRYIRKDGEVIWGNLTTSLIRSDDGEPFYFISIVEEITERKRIESLERRQRESLAALNEITSHPNLPLAEQLERALHLVAQQLGLPLGIVSRVEGNDYTVISHVAPPETLHNGQIFALDDTYCSITLSQDRVVGIDDMGQSEYSGHPCYSAFALEAYIGAPVTVDGKVYGTVNFSSPEPYSRAFDDSDREFVRLLARWVGSAIERDRFNRRLKESEARLQTIIDNEPECVKVISAEGVLVDMNQIGLDILEADSIEQINAKRLDQMVLPEYRKAFRNLNYQVLTGNKATLEFQVEGLRGSIRWLNTHAAPLRNANGDVIEILAVTRDVTEQKHAEAELRLAASVFSHAHEGIMICDAAQRILDVNPYFTEITGYTEEEVVGLTPRLLSSGSQGAEFYREMWQSVKRNGYWEGELWNRRKDGTLFAERLTISAIYDAEGETTHYIGTFSDITLVREQQSRLEYLAHHDALTHLPNRTLLADRMTQTLYKARRSGNLVAVCYLDLDGFKEVNDDHGHEAGDRLLIEISERLRHCVRGADTVARLGGDEFVLLLELESQQECDRVMQRVLHAIAQPVTIGDQQAQVSGSIGIAQFPADDVDPDTLLRHADQAMYSAKNAGKNQYYIYDPTH